MISLNTFMALSKIEKIKTLYLQGEFIVSIRYYKHKVNLYLLANNYVEVFYNPKTDKVDKIAPLDFTEKRMKFYTDQISLPAVS
ncbi:hypothetical protein [Marinigracilibium pacificum]|uniref:Uncharacterized protein n=1 Tax=Marinigracilibium pacificum TaxID=2729599 RepID=A0A848IR75_9BACT|nr:hypothetical protein [Marinigracilibium pacificum]NMM46857.1 hypothetical protein [Marinigracilibium pacificum]